MKRQGLVFLILLLLSLVAFQVQGVAASSSYSFELEVYSIKVFNAGTFTEDIYDFYFVFKMINKFYNEIRVLPEDTKWVIEIEKELVLHEILIGNNDPTSSFNTSIDLFIVDRTLNTTKILSNVVLFTDFQRNVDRSTFNGVGLISEVVRTESISKYTSSVIIITNQTYFSNDFELKINVTEISEIDPSSIYYLVIGLFLLALMRRARRNDYF